MRCSHCQSQMEETDTITEGGARQTWYRCPLCAAAQTISQPCRTGLQRIGNAQRCSCDWSEAQGIGRTLY